jgi:hypothetical protein
MGILLSSSVRQSLLTETANGGAAIAAVTGTATEDSLGEPGDM